MTRSFWPLFLSSNFYYNKVSLPFCGTVRRWVGLLILVCGGQRSALGVIKEGRSPWFWRQSLTVTWGIPDWPGSPGDLLSLSLQGYKFVAISMDSRSKLGFSHPHSGTAVPALSPQTLLNLFHALSLAFFFQSLAHCGFITKIKMFSPKYEISVVELFFSSTHTGSFKLSCPCSEKAA